ncbi:conserved phage C-terminal domain-containing protein [Exiguobacterium sp.]|uniref:conserved phage C-terminal domain-containing protein n=1 Tax=Exiguobacterium sp. TaxID=44751 RepID=UPI00289D360E|nr:conserved phage C-terminal domain-containing protein [Exiguobacterium sp.]
MPAVRTKKEAGRFVSLDKTVLHDSRLSLQAKGLHSYMMSMPDDWVFYETELQKHFTNGRDSIRKTMRELQTFGYLVKRQSKKSDGTFATVEMWLYETPQPTVDWKSVDGKPADGESADGKSDTTNNDCTNNDSTNNDEPKKPIVEQASTTHLDIIDYLNSKTGKKYKASTKSTRSLINARIKDGFTLDDFKQVIDNKIRDWTHDPKMSKFIRPETLFGTKFESYLNETHVVRTSATPDHSQYDPSFGKELPF